MEIISKMDEESMEKFRKREFHMGVSLKSPYMLFKYLGALFPHIHIQLMLFRTKTIDGAIIQSQ